jgi:hypothetical protein
MRMETHHLGSILTQREESRRNQDDPILNNSNSDFSRCSADHIDSELDAALMHKPQHSSSKDLQLFPDSILQSKSSDSSFSKTFNLLLEQSDSLRWQYNEIIKHQLNTSNELYSSFVQKIITKCRQVKSGHHHQPKLSSKLQEETLTFEAVVDHIEKCKIISA